MGTRFIPEPDIPPISPAPSPPPKGMGRVWGRENPAPIRPVAIPKAYVV